MQATPVPMSAAVEARISGVPPAPELRETHTGIVVLIGNSAYKIKKPVVTDFLDFSTSDRRERACAQEVALNRRLAPDSYVGIAHFSDPRGGAAEPGRVRDGLRRLQPARRHRSVEGAAHRVSWLNTR